MAGHSCAGRRRLPRTRHHHGGAVSAWWRGRHRGPPCGRSHGPRPEANPGGGKQGWRRWRHWHGASGQSPWRRLQRADVAFLDCGAARGRQSAQALALVHARPAQAHCPLYRRPHRLGGACRQPLENLRRLHCLGQSTARGGDLWLQRQLRHHACAYGTAQGCHRHLHAARALYRCGSCRVGLVGRPN